MSRLTSLSHAITAGAVTTTLAYNPASQIVTRARDNSAYQWTGFVAADRTYTVNGLNQYVTGGPAIFTYDANGNLTGDGSRTFAYDIENRLISASDGLQLDYDPLGRLWRTSGGTSGTTHFLYDGDELSAEYDGAGTLLQRYVHGDKDDDPVVWYAGASMTSPRYLYADHQGSIVATADANGSLIATNSYDDYGISKNSANGSLRPYGRFGFTGQAWLPDLGMYHYKARVYSPTLGRFLQTDPIGYDDQINLYAYVANDPVNGRDPTGQWIDTIADVAFIIYDGIKIAKEGATRENVGALGADALAAVIPGVTGAGIGVRAAARAEQAAVRTDQAAKAGGRFASKAEKAALFERAGGKCEYCGRGMTREPGQANSIHADHITPHAKGGKTESENLAGSCRTCNLSKGSKDLSPQPGPDKFVPPNPNDRIQDRIRNN